MLKIISELIIPVVLLIIPLYGLIKHVKVYEVFVDGAKDGINTMTKIFPALLAMLVAVGVLRSSGALDGFAKLIEPFTSRIGMPSEVIPLALIRPLSGSGALGIATELIKSKGPDSFTAKLASVMYGSTETTFYVLAVYFGSVGVKKMRHSIIAGIAADIVAILSSVFYSRLFF
ncbi:spore maturation protein [Thermoanaerobacterium thermosaccharolyticum]|uniref:Nucleoside recognition domain protein n=2 Tax=Thermoanaerobacterium thermosaccharolyticum TaxID=1517 RepID=A0A231VGJ8_THETR|nr:nucleoside recognition domain-containing protein [Thermoanaerobacterium thermosaccharolyticum]AGB17832.1 putative membrane protein [Thermoanaerobacterium thermosaccharolyticum M0795]AST57533.1 nucleoside recognition domain protein [Thermoanaerobacterium thermosaccharolyticum]KAA5806043.1 spore maturation protein [Thermoanaerobacterium thermosaccharolyticum]MCP2240996.1 spore maturation protein B [Thermoanaerobacterium thermosaccharolyticum]OXT07305.1 spore maturation protein [Thermoanaeroba